MSPGFWVPANAKLGQFDASMVDMPLQRGGRVDATDNLQAVRCHHLVNALSHVNKPMMVLRKL